MVGDLIDTISFQIASQGMEIVIAAASTATPTQKGDNFKSVDKYHIAIRRKDYEALIIIHF